MKLIVLLHGYGASGPDLAHLSTPWAGPGREFVALNAPRLCAGMGPGYEWFGLDGWMPGTSFGPFIPRIEQAVMDLKIKIRAELDARNLGWRDLVLMGFSQGSIMAFAVGLSEDMPCEGIMGYSGAYMIPVPPRSKPPVLIVHGGADMVVAPTAYHDSVRLLNDHDVPTTSLLIPGCGHWIDPAGLGAGRVFLDGLVCIK